MSVKHAVTVHILWQHTLAWHYTCAGTETISCEWKSEHFPCMRILLNIHGCTVLQKPRSNLKILGMGKVTYWGSTNIRCLHTKFCWYGNLVSGICAHLFMILKIVTNMTIDFRESKWNWIWVSYKVEFMCDRYKSKFKFAWQLLRLIAGNKFHPTVITSFSAKAR